MEMVLHAHHNFNAERDMHIFKTNADYYFRKFHLVGEVLEYSNESKAIYVSDFCSTQCDPI